MPVQGIADGNLQFLGVAFGDHHDLVVGVQGIESQAVAVIQGDAELGEHIEVVGLAEVLVENQVQVAAARRDQPVDSPPVAVPRVEQRRVVHAQADLRVQRLFGEARIEQQHAAHLVAEVGRKTAGVGFHAGDGAGVDRAEDAVVIADMERVEQFQAIEVDRRFVVFAAAKMRS